MGRVGSTHEADWEHGEAGSEHRGSLPFEVRRLWREFKDFVPKALVAGDMVGEAVMDAYRLAVKAGQLFVRFGRYLIALGALVGLTSPATGGWGVAALSGSRLAAWAPVALLPAAIGLVRVVLGSFGPLERESERDSMRQQRKHEKPDPQGGLKREAQRRKAINGQLGAGSDKAMLLEEHGFVHDELAETGFQLRARELPDIDLILMRWTRKHGLREVASRGAIDDMARGLLGALGWEDMVDGDRAIAEVLAPLEYSHASVAFSAGAHHYLLTGVAGSPIPGHAHLTISHAATRLVERYADGDEPPLSLVGDR
jgi:hypothetical protein